MEYLLQVYLTAPGLYKEIVVGCTEKSLFFSRGSLRQHQHAYGPVQSTGILLVTHRGIPYRCSTRITLLVLGEVLQLPEFTLVGSLKFSKGE